LHPHAFESNERSDTDAWVVVDHACIGLVRCMRSSATGEKRFMARIRILVSAGSMTKPGFDTGHHLV
jgi:hypothetical protein